jgi:nucleotide-binding universal stress UspA family protein
MAPRILVPLDGSPGSETALAEIADLARAQRATVCLLHVAAPAEVLVAADGEVIAYADQVAAWVVNDVRAYLATVAATLRGLEVETAVRFGEPAEEILDEAQRSGADLIAMATHRRGGVERLLAGSVAEHVGRRSPVPVLLLEHGDRQAPTPPVPAEGRLVHRRFWCAWSRRDVEVDLIERGLPGLPWAVSVHGCSAFEPRTAIECQRRCIDAGYRRQWEAALPVLGACQRT